MKEKAKVGDVVKGWKIVEIYLTKLGNQQVSMAKVESTLNDKKSEYRLTLLTNGQVGWPDRRRPDLIKKNTTHGLSKTRLYRIWKGMKNRCYNPKQSSYDRYGGRDIIICKEWQEDFLNFKKWADENGYDDTLTLDRINIDGNYEPSNCRWSTWGKQCENKSTRLDFEEYEAFGEKKSIYEWSHNDRCSVSTACLHYRIRAGWEIERAITTPSERGGQFNYKKFYEYVKKNNPDIIKQYLSSI